MNATWPLPHLTHLLDLWHNKKDLLKLTRVVAVEKHFKHGIILIIGFRQENNRYKEFYNTAETDVNCYLVRCKKAKNALPNIFPFTDVYWKNMLSYLTHKQKIHRSHLKKMKSNRIKHEQRDFRHVLQAYQLM